jgi:hypothetical protein
MTSFVNTMANDVWSDEDITNHTETRIAAEFPRWPILQRKVLAQMEGIYALTVDEQAQYDQYKAFAFQMGALADAARADMGLLLQVFILEAAQARLAQPLRYIDGSEDAPSIPQNDPVDADERAAAQAVVDAASQEAKDLAAQREAARQASNPPADPAVTTEVSQ